MVLWCHCYHISTYTDMLSFKCLSLELNLIQMALISTSGTVIFGTWYDSFRISYYLVTILIPKHHRLLRSKKPQTSQNSTSKPTSCYLTNASKGKSVYGQFRDTQPKLHLIRQRMGSSWYLGSAMPKSMKKVILIHEEGDPYPEQQWSLSFVAQHEWRLLSISRENLVLE